MIRLKDQTELAWTAFRVCEEYSCTDEASKVFNDYPRELNLCELHMSQVQRAIFLS